MKQQKKRGLLIVGIFFLIFLILTIITFFGIELFNYHAPVALIGFFLSTLIGWFFVWAIENEQK